ncbi:hypothetical protein BGZ76_008680 [Entomortierella beljakovae]|nr:hypothetical protein BGZ76_008680 [Entomortierella beljakovae]
MINLVFFNLTALSFDYNNMTPDLILAIVHRPKWETIRVFHESDNIDEADQVFSLPDHFQATFWMIQMIPRFCLNLKEFDMIQHVMDMDDVEEGQWACKNLKDLKVRIKGLDTKEKIDKTIDMYRNEKRLMLSSGDKRETLLDDSIEARVARHLLQFEKLETIWIGTKTWRVKRMDFT